MRNTLILAVLAVAMIGGFYWYARTGNTAASTPSAAVPTATPKESASSTAGAPSAGTYTAVQVAQHNTAQSCWSSIEGGVYDLTSWISQHPGGEAPILSICGKDGTSAFEGQHGNDRRATAELATFKIGTLAP